MRCVSPDDTIPQLIRPSFHVGNSAQLAGLRRYNPRVVLYFDGASRNNPLGPASFGWVLYAMDEHGSDADRISSGSNYLGYDVTSNQAEYAGLVAGLTYIRDNIRCDSLYIRGDSQVVINQMTGEYCVRSSNLVSPYKNAKDILEEIDCDDYFFRHINRERNREADQLADNWL
jgi:ribonuclease HI